MWNAGRECQGMLSYKGGDAGTGTGSGAVGEIDCKLCVTGGKKHRYGEYSSSKGGIA